MPKAKPADVQSKQPRTRRTIAAALIKAGMKPPEQLLAIEDDAMAKAMVKAGRRYHDAAQKKRAKVLEPKLAAFAREHGLTPRQLKALFRK